MKNRNTLIISIFFLFFHINSSFGLTIDRVILATDANQNYIQFWPVVAKLWKNLIGVQPTLALIAPDNVKIDEMLGDVIRFQPIPGVKTSLHAQCIRELLPILFPNDVCLLSDIDMLPLNRDYFFQSVENIPDDCFTVYRDKAVLPTDLTFPMCYNAAKGSIFQEVFKVFSIEEIEKKIIAWNQLNLGWCTDEKMLFHYLTRWEKYNTHCIKVGHHVDRSKRIDRINWHYNINSIIQDHYIDCHCPRPYLKYKQDINTIVYYAMKQNRALKEKE
jgi:hypothetical protein